MTGEFKTISSTRGYFGTTSSLSLTNLYLIYIIPPSSSLLLFTSYCFSLSSFLSHSLTVFYHFPLSLSRSHSPTDIYMLSLSLSLFLSLYFISHQYNFLIYILLYYFFYYFLYIIYRHNSYLFYYIFYII